MKNYKGSVSIYFIFAIVLIISVIMSITEIARINCQKLYLQIATNSGLDSMASLFHRKLYDFYNLYGVEYRTKEGLIDEYLGYIYPYFVDEDMYIKNWYIANVKEENINLSFQELTDDTNFEKEILHYMKYKLIGKTVEYFGKTISINNENDFDKVVDASKEAFEEVDKNEVYGEVYNRYFDFADDIKKLESYVKNMTKAINNANTEINHMKTINVNESKNNLKSVTKKSNELKSDINDLISNINNYKTKMNNFRNSVEKSRQQYEKDVNSGKYEYNDDVKDFIESEFEHFVKFVDENSDMNKKVEAKKRECDDIIKIVQDCNNDLNNFVSEYERIEDEIKYERSQKGDDYDSDAIKELMTEKKDLEDTVKSYLKDLKDVYKDMKIDDINLAVSSDSHKEEEGLLKKLIGFKGGMFLNLVLNSEDISKIDSNSINYTKLNMLSHSNSISVDKLILGEYELEKFNYYNKELNDELTSSGSTKLEVEKLITGKLSDLDAISEIVNRILLMRIAMNVLHIYKDSSKRQLAREFAVILFSSFSPIMVEVMFLLIITAWGTAQSIADVKKLLSNKRVNLIHDNESWTVGVESIIGMAKNQTLSGGESEDDRGFALSYKDYLRILLATENQSQVNSRMAGLIEQNIKSEEASFDFEKLIYSFDVENSFMCRHYFTNFIFVNATDEKLYDEYVIKTSGYRCYYDD